MSDTIPSSDLDAYVYNSAKKHGRNTGRNSANACYAKRVDFTPSGFANNAAFKDLIKNLNLAPDLITHYLKVYSRGYIASYERAYNERDAVLSLEAKERNRGIRAGKKAANEHYRNTNFKNKSQAYIDGYNAGYDSLILRSSTESDRLHGEHIGRRAAKYGYIKRDFTKETNIPQAYIDGYNKGYDSVTITKEEKDWLRGYNTGKNGGAKGTTRRVFTYINESEAYITGYNKGYEEGSNKLARLGKKSAVIKKNSGLSKQSLKTINQVDKADDSLAASKNCHLTSDESSPGCSIPNTEKSNLCQAVTTNAVNLQLTEMQLQNEIKSYFANVPLSNLQLLNEFIDFLKVLSNNHVIAAGFEVLDQDNLNRVTEDINAITYPSCSVPGLTYLDYQHGQENYLQESLATNPYGLFSPNRYLVSNQFNLKEQTTSQDLPNTAVSYAEAEYLQHLIFTA